MLNNRRIYAPLLALALLLCSCIEVKDFGEYWKQGVVDSCVNDAILADLKKHGDEDKTMEIRSIKFGGHSFAMIREHPEDKGGEMLRYEIEGDTLVTFNLNDKKRSDFLHFYPNSSVIVTSETATIPVLDHETTELLAQLAGDDSYWIENAHLAYNPTHRNDCIHQP